MKLGLVTKLYKRVKTTSKKKKKNDDHAVFANCDVIAIFPIYDQFRAIWKPDLGRIVCKIYIFVNSNLSYYKN